MFRRSKKQKIHSPENGIPLPKHNQIRQKQRELLEIMACTNIGLEELHNQAAAYFKTLDTSLSSIAKSVLEVMHTPSLLKPPQGDIHYRLYDILILIAQRFRDEQDEVFLHTLGADLTSQDLVLDNKPKDVARLVFILFGVLTMLYIPLTDPKPGELQMRLSDFGKNITRPMTMTWPVGSQPLNDDLINLSFDEMLIKYSPYTQGPIPKPLILQLDYLTQSQRGSRILRSQNVSFYTLDQLLNVKVRWTTSICEHLEFDLKTRTLKLFGVPSYCAVLASVDPNKTYLDSLFHLLLGKEQDGPKSKDFTAASFFRELLSTYRLIFGQHADSRNLIKKYNARGKLFGYKSPFHEPHRSALGNDHDPLLERLCCNDSRQESLFTDLEMLNLKNVYVLDIDFPYFANRLYVLQEFVENQCPNDWRILWRDRRDVAKFWTIWAVVLFGVPTVILSVVQTVLTGLQLRSSK